jgi:hypothetical protein
MNAYLIAGVAGLGFAANTFASELLPPFRVEAKNGPIDVEIGHSAPWVTDLNGDGKFDLLVGQFGEGKLRVYTNKGTASQPKFEDFAWFQGGSADARVPSG